nr:hypothetical protein [Tanacetum cinerariifolium]
MAELHFNNDHNKVVYLLKPKESQGFHQIIDFLNGLYIRYALTVNPTNYASMVRQFWCFASEVSLPDVTPHPSPNPMPSPPRQSSPPPIPFGLVLSFGVVSTESIPDIPFSSRPSKPVLETIFSPMYLRQASNDDEHAESVSLALVFDITTWEIIPTEFGLGEIHVLTRADGIVKSLVSDKYKTERATETKAGDIMYMFVDKKYPLTPETIQRMLNYGLEIDRDSSGNDLTTAIQLIQSFLSQLNPAP